MKPCRIEWCTRPAKAKGLCDAHTQRARRGADMDAPFNRKRPNGSPPLICSVPGCSKIAPANDLCPMHAARTKAGTEITGPPKKAPNGRAKYVQAQGYVVISVPADTPGARGLRLKTKNASRFGEIFEHRYVMQNHLGRALKPTEQVHHKDGNRRNNHISNLELKSGPHGKGITVRDGITKAIDYLVWHIKLTKPQAAALASIRKMHATSA